MHWELGIQVMKFCDQYDIITIFLTRFWKIQDELMDLDNVLHRPLRFRGPNPFIGLFDLFVCEGVKSNTTGKVTNRWRSAKKFLSQRYSHTAGCITNCWDCGHQCMFKLGGVNW